MKTEKESKIKVDRQTERERERDRERGYQSFGIFGRVDLITFFSFSSKLFFHLQRKKVLFCFVAFSF